MPDPVPTSHEQPLPGQTDQVARLARTVEDLTARLDAERSERLRLEGRISAQPQTPEPFKPRDDREWGLALALGARNVELARIAAMEDESKAAQADQLARDFEAFKGEYQRWQNDSIRRSFEEERNAERLTSRLDAYGLAAGDPRRKVVEAALKGGMSFEDVEATYLKPFKDGINTEANRAAAASAAAATQIEGGSPSGGIPPAPNAPADPSKSVSEAVIGHYKNSGGPATFARLFGRQDVPKQ